jgi:hypothetical protein
MSLKSNNECKLEEFLDILYNRIKYLQLRPKFYFTYYFHRTCAQSAAAAQLDFHHPFILRLAARTRRAKAFAMLKPDIEKYLPYVDHLDLTQEEKIELIHTVWHICETFVDRAFGLHPSQQLPGADIRKIVLEHTELINSDLPPDIERQLQELRSQEEP